MPTSFERDTAVEPISDRVYRASLSRGWWVARGPHGGYLAAILLRAMTAELGRDDRHVRSMTVHYTAPPEEGGIEIHTRVERAGRSMTFMSCRALQGERLIALGLATFAAGRDGIDFVGAQPPPAASFEDAQRVPSSGDRIPPFLAQLDMRFALGAIPFTGADRAELGGWTRPVEPLLADACVIAMLTDAWAPAVFPVVTEPLVAPTIDLTIHFRADLPLPHARPEDFYLGRFSSALVRDGFFDEDGTLWAPDGTLVAQSRQLALAIPLG